MVRRFSPLSAVYEAELAALVGSRLAKWCAVLVFVGYAVAMVVVARTGNHGSLDTVAANGARWLAWFAGMLVAFSASRNADRIEHGAELLALVGQRGIGNAGLAAARPVAIGRRIARIVGVPAVGLAALALALSNSTQTLVARVVFVVLLAGWVVVVAGLLALLTDVSLRLTPERPGWMLLALVCVPHLARSVWPLTPSAPALMHWLLHAIQAAVSAVS